ncbi:MAG: anhydro-N-acetylmuramic acid kinase [Burkholderiales bacterium]|nr:anhydro-N-acetylmuramic acid kinase [Burkholderiales bacterium]
MLLNERYIGLMSGTSVDGVDAVLADFSGHRVASLGHAHLPFSSALRASLQALMQSGADEIERAGDASVALAQAYGEAVRALLAKTGLTSKDVAAIGAHGQTIRHRPERGFTWQLNHPALLSELTGIAVVADFRSRDVAAGGQGAPLVPAFHAAVFQSDAPRAVVNIGGIANVTLLPATGSPEAAQPVLGFDTGPGNTLLDAWCERHTGKPFDERGAWGATGRVDEALLARLLSEPYFAKPAPKSTGRERFNLAWFDAALAAHGVAEGASGRMLNPVDVQATLVALTARSIANAVDGRAVFVCGGGVFNEPLFRAIPGARSTADIGVDPMQVEALAFAWLARQCFNSEPGNLPAVTGARGPRVLGAVYPA